MRSTVLERGYFNKVQGAPSWGRWTLGAVGTQKRVPPHNGFPSMIFEQRPGIPRWEAMKWRVSWGRGCLSDRGQTHKHTEKTREYEREIEIEMHADRDPVKRHREQGRSELVVVQGWMSMLNWRKSRTGAYTGSKDQIMPHSLRPCSKYRGRVSSMMWFSLWEITMSPVWIHYISHYYISNWTYVSHCHISPLICHFSVSVIPTWEGSQLRWPHHSNSQSSK